MMYLECDNCGKKFQTTDELKRIFPDGFRQAGLLCPPCLCGKCPGCGESIYMLRTDDIDCSMHGDATDDIDCSMHGGAEVPDNPKPLGCPSCGAEGCMAQVDSVLAYAHIQGINPDGLIDWAGESDADWNSQKPAHNPPGYICLACNEEFSWGDLSVAEVDATKPEMALTIVYTINELIRTANEYYPDDMVSACWDFDNEAPKQDPGAVDTLALFICRELGDIYDTCESKEYNIGEAARAIDAAAGELWALSRGLKRCNDENKGND